MTSGAALKHLREAQPGREPSRPSLILIDDDLLIVDSLTFLLAPAFDVAYSYNPSGDWTASHQMTLNGKRDHFTLADFEAGAQAAQLKRGRGLAILKEVQAAVTRWPEFAAVAKVSQEKTAAIARAHRLSL